MIEYDSFWTVELSAIGITNPDIISAQSFGKTGLYYLNQPAVSKDTTQAILALNRKYRANLAKILIEQAEECATLNFSALTKTLEERFTSTTQTIGWLEQHTQIHTSEMHSFNLSQDAITAWMHQRGNSMMNCFDDICDLLISYALPEAKHVNRFILRAIFGKDEEIEYLNLPIAHFKIKVNIDKNDVPKASLPPPLQPTIPLQPTAQSHQSTEAKSTNTLSLELHPTVPTSGSLKDGIEPTPNSITTEPTPNSTTTVTSTGSSLCTASITSGTAMSKVIPRKAQLNQIAETEPITNSLSSRSTLTPASRPQAQTTSKNTAISEDKTTSKNMSRSVSSVRAKQSAEPTIKAICYNDDAGCYYDKCSFRHENSKNVQCFSHTKNPRYKCRGVHCRFRHDKTEDSPPPSPPPLQIRKRPRPGKSATEVTLPNTQSYTHLTDLHHISVPPTGIGCHLPHKKRRLRTRRRVDTTTQAEQRLHLLHSVGQNITNTGINVLHDCIVSKEELAVLRLGLSFVPHNLTNKKRYITEATERFVRQVRIKKYFATELDSQTLNNSTEAKLHLRVNKSLTLLEANRNFNPPISKSPIESYLKTASSKLATISSNLSPTPTSEIRRWTIFNEVTRKLASRKDIIIKPADKNLGVTVMNRQWYITEALGPNYLGNKDTYLQVNQSPNIDSLCNDLRTICKEQSWLSQTQITRLTKDLLSDVLRDKVKLCRIYFLPKLHKPTLSLRPICASQNWLTYWTSVYIHLSLFPLLKQIPTYIANSAQLVSTLDSINPPKYFQFIPGDVDNLYPSINIDEALDAIHTFLSGRLGFPRARTDFIIKLLHWILKNNYVAFGESTFLQLQGTAMGTPCAVVVACIFMHIIEEEALAIFKSRYYTLSTIFLNKRFIDDYILIVSDTETGQIFMDILNTRREAIHITFTIENREAQFLDLTLYRTRHEHAVAVRAYAKPMNKHLFLPPSSCHPPHIFKGWILGYGRRLRLNCTANSDYTLALGNFRTQLTSRGYKDSIITEIFDKIPDRQAIIQSVRMQSNASGPPVTNIGTPFIVKYSRSIQTMLPLIKQALTLTEVAHMDPHFAHLFPASLITPLIVFSRSENLRELIVPSTLS